MTINTDLFTGPNEVQKMLVTLIDGYIEEGKTGDEIIGSMAGLLDDEPEAVMGLCGVWEGLSPSEGDAQVQVADLGETPSLDLEDLLYHHSGGG